MRQVLEDEHQHKVGEITGYPEGRKDYCQEDCHFYCRAVRHCGGHGKADSLCSCFVHPAKHGRTGLLKR